MLALPHIKHFLQAHPNSHVRLMCIIIGCSVCLCGWERACDCGYMRITIINVLYYYPVIVESNFHKPKSGTPSHSLVFNDAFAISKQSILYLRRGRPKKSRQRQLGVLFFWCIWIHANIVQLLSLSVAGARTRNGKTRNKFELREWS